MFHQLAILKELEVHFPKLSKEKQNRVSRRTKRRDTRLFNPLLKVQIEIDVLFPLLLRVAIPAGIQPADLEPGSEIEPASVDIVVLTNRVDPRVPALFSRGRSLLNQPAGNALVAIGGIHLQVVQVQILEERLLIGGQTDRFVLVEGAQSKAVLGNLRKLVMFIGKGLRGGRVSFFKPSMPGRGIPRDDHPPVQSKGLIGQLQRWCVLGGQLTNFYFLIFRHNQSPSQSLE